MISAIFIKRPIFATVLSIIIVIGGIVSIQSLPITQYPEITPVQVTVSANYPGADADTVANTVAAPLETAINGVDNMMYMQSACSSSGRMTLTLYFTIDTDPDTAEVQVNNRVNKALTELPDVVRNIGVTVQKRSSTFLMIIALTSPDGKYDENYIANYGNVYVLDAIKRVEGANQAEVLGSPDLAMRVWLDPAKMAGFGLTATDIQQAISQQNQQFGVGSLGQSPTDGEVELTIPVVTDGRFTEPWEFENIILRADSQGAAIVRLKDVGRVEEGMQSYLQRSRLNGNPATLIAVYQQVGSNAIEVSKNVAATMKQMSQSFPDGLDYKISLDTTNFVKASISEVIDTLIIATFLVVLVTFLFLQDLRATLIPTLAIIISIVGTFIGMQAMGFSINLLTLFGLVLAVGTVCDDAIVVVENVDRNMREKKLSSLDASFLAMKEITGPCIATSLVLIAVFVPVAFMGGTTGRLYQQFAITLSISVAISTFVALTLTPALAAIIMRPISEDSNFFFRTFNKFIDKLTNFYKSGVEWTIRMKYLALLVFILMLASAYFLITTVPTSFVPPEDQGYLMVAAILPDGASLDRSQKVTSKISEALQEHPAVLDCSEITGFSMLDGQFKPNAGTVFVVLKDFAERSEDGMSSDDVILFARKKFAGIKDAIIIPINPPPIPGLGSQGGFEFWVQSRGVGDTSDLQRSIFDIIAKGNESPVTTNLNSTINANSKQLRATINRNKAETMGVPSIDVYNSLQALFGSLNVSQFSKYGRVWNVVMQAEPRYRADPEDIQRLYVKQSTTGEMVPLSALVDTEFTQGAEMISRFNGFPAAKITGDAALGFSSGEAIKEMESIAEDTLSAEYDYQWAGQALEEKNSGGTTAIVFIFALIMVFLILSAQYEQWSLPFVVLTMIPFGIFGALVAIWLKGMSNDVYFQVGLVTLIGLSTKNSILIVEFAEQKFKEGLSAYDAAVLAAKLRLRPILMTAISFILGAIPLLTATGAGANSRYSIGTGLVGGMILATSLGLFFVPLFYYLIRLFSDYLSTLKRRK